MASIGARGGALDPVEYLNSYPELKSYPQSNGPNRIRILIADEMTLDFKQQCHESIGFLQRFHSALEDLAGKDLDYLHLYMPHRFRGAALTVVIPAELSRLVGALGMVIKVYIPAPPYPQEGAS